MARHMVLTLDVTDLNQAQVDSLRSSLWAQTEALDDNNVVDGYDLSYPDVAVVSDEIVDV